MNLLMQQLRQKGLVLQIHVLVFLLVLVLMILSNTGSINDKNNNNNNFLISTVTSAFVINNQPVRVRCKSRSILLFYFYTNDNIGSFDNSIPLTKLQHVQQLNQHQHVCQKQNTYKKQYKIRQSTVPKTFRQSTFLSLSSNNNNNNNNNNKFNEDVLKSFQSNDPYVVLGISRKQQNQVDFKDVKRAYRKLALQYHPDVVTTKDSSATDKKIASDRFAKINWAYETIQNNINSDRQRTTTTSTSTSTSNNDGWVPPHRRSGSYKSSSTSSSSPSDTSTSNDPFSQDYYNKVPFNTEQDQYSSDGDSFGKIFTDLFTDVVSGAASAAGSSSSSSRSNTAATIVTDFVDFLERNIMGTGSNSDGWSSSSTNTNNNNNDTNLRILLQTGTVQEIGHEMDETELVVQQLQTKKTQIDNELYTVQAELKQGGLTFAEQMQYQTQNDELQARAKIINNYIQISRTRLLKLQNRYKELIVEDPSRAQRASSTSSSSSSVWDDIRRETASTSTSTGNTSPSSSTSRTGTGTNNPKTNTNTNSNNDNNDEWRSESFGSFGRGRGSTRRRRRNDSTTTGTSTADDRTTTTTNSYRTTQQQSSSPSTGSTSTTTNRNSSTSTSSSRPRSSSTTTEFDMSVLQPPHRRNSGYTSSSSSSSEYDNYLRKEEDQRRLRDIKVEEEFDKLKKELGL